MKQSCAGRIWGLSFACWFNAIIITKVLSVNTNDKGRVTHLVVASVNVNSREDSAMDVVLEMCGSLVEGRAMKEYRNRESISSSTCSDVLRRSRVARQL